MDVSLLSTKLSSLILPRKKTMMRCYYFHDGRLRLQLVIQYQEVVRHLQDRSYGIGLLRLKWLWPIPSDGFYYELRSILNWLYGAILGLISWSLKGYSG